MMMNLDTFEMYEYYMSNNINLINAGKHFGISATGLSKRFLKEGLKIKGRNDTRVVHLNNDILKALYCDKNYSTNELAQYFSCAKGTICNRLIKLGVSRSSEEAKSIRQNNYILWTKELVDKAKKTLGETNSLLETAKIHSLSVGTLGEKNKLWGINVGRWENKKSDVGKKLLEKFKDYDKVADILGVTKSSLSCKNNRDWKVDLSDNSTLLGIPTIATDGVKYRSKLESYVANFLFENKIKYRYEVRVCSTRLWTCDFVIGDLWVEVDGLGDRRIETGIANYSDKHGKIAYYEANGFNYIILKKPTWKKQLIHLFNIG